LCKQLMGFSTPSGSKATGASPLSLASLGAPPVQHLFR